MSAPKDKGNQQQVYIKILEDLLKLPDNRECADCGTKAPRWSSTNLGVFVCIRCSGIHRSLGTHISKVKSVSLDKWTQDQVDVMKSMGNARAKEVYEAYMPEGYPRATPASDNFVLEQWIKDKYERKKFMKRDGADDVVHHRERDHRQPSREEREPEREHREHRERPREPQKAVVPQHPRVGATKPPPVAVPAPKAAPVSAAPDLLNFDEPQSAVNHNPAPASPTSANDFGDFTSATGPTKDKNSIMQLYNTPLAPSANSHPPGPYPPGAYPPGAWHGPGPNMTTTTPYPGPNYNINIAGPGAAVPPNYYVAAGRGMGAPQGPNYNVNLNPNPYGNMQPNYYQPPNAPYGVPYGHPGMGIGYTAAPPPNNMVNGLNNLRI